MCYRRRASNRASLHSHYSRLTKWLLQSLLHDSLIITSGKTEWAVQAALLCVSLQVISWRLLSLWIIVWHVSNITIPKELMFTPCISLLDPLPYLSFFAYASSHSFSLPFQLSFTPNNSFFPSVFSSLLLCPFPLAPLPLCLSLIFRGQLWNPTPPQSLLPAVLLLLLLNV